MKEIIKKLKTLCLADYMTLKKGSKKGGFMEALPFLIPEGPYKAPIIILKKIVSGESKWFFREIKATAMMWR